MTTMLFTIEDQVACVEREIRQLRKPPIRIPLSNEFTLIVEERDLWIFGYWNWGVRNNKGNRTAYLYRRKGGKGYHFHREVIAAPPEYLVDHINHNGLDNRRSNLRLVTHKQNMWNVAPKNNKKYKGVELHKFSGLWRATLRNHEDLYICTYHKTEEEAARAVDEAYRNHYGEFAYQNFPTTDPVERNLALWEAVLATLKQIQSPKLPLLL